MAWGFNNTNYQTMNHNQYNFNNNGRTYGMRGFAGQNYPTGGYGYNQNYPYQAPNMAQNFMWQNSGQRHALGQNMQNSMWQNGRGQSAYGQNQMNYSQMGQNQNGPYRQEQNLANSSSPQAPPISSRPIDEKTLREIQAGFNSSGNGTESKPHVETPDTSNNNMLANIQNFAQDERNSSIFYKYLSNAARSKAHKEILEQISGDSAKNINEYNALYKNISGKDSEIKEIQIDNTIEFNQGIRWAIETESKALSDLSEIFETADSDNAQKKLSSMLCKKISRLSLLHLILFPVNS